MMNFNNIGDGTGTKKNIFDIKSSPYESRMCCAGYVGYVDGMYKTDPTDLSVYGEITTQNGLAINQHVEYLCWEKIKPIIFKLITMDANIVNVGLTCTWSPCKTCLLLLVPSIMKYLTDRNLGHIPVTITYHHLYSKPTWLEKTNQNINYINGWNSNNDAVTGYINTMALYGVIEEAIETMIGGGKTGNNQYINIDNVSYGVNSSETILTKKGVPRLMIKQSEFAE